LGYAGNFESIDMSKMGQTQFRAGGILVRSKQNIAGKRHIMLYQQFLRRHNEDETHDSICRECLATIATVRNEIDLDRQESAHVCNPVNLYRINQACTPLPFLLGQDRDPFLVPSVVR
jgi:hypothetical protein